MSLPINEIHFPDSKPQNIAEAKFVDCMRRGIPCRIGNSSTRPRKPEREGKDANVIRADLIRLFALGNNASPNHIRLEGAWVTGGLNLTHADIGGILEFLRCHFEEEVVLRNTECHALCMNGSRLAKGLWGDGIQVKGTLYLRHRFVSLGMVSLPRAKIGDDLDCIGSIFVNPSKNAFFADGAKVDGCLRLLKSKFRGKVSMSGISVGTHLDCREATFNDGMDIAAAKIKNVLAFCDIKGRGLCNFADARMGGIQDDDASRDKFNFSLYALTYRHFTVPNDIQSRIDWLKKPREGDRFSPQPFQQAAKVLFAMGYDNDARKVLLEKERLLTEKGQFGKWHKRLRRCWDFWAGYGYEWWRTLIAAAAIIGIGWAVFAGANYYGHIVPHQPVVMAKLEKEIKKGHECTKLPPTGAAVCLLPQYPRFDALAYSADVFIPFFALHQEPYWYPQPRDKDNYDARFFLTIFLWLEIIAGWILTSLFVLTITGLLKPRQSSLE